MQVSPENVSEAITTLSLAAENVSDWAHNISLKLNPDKTKAIYFGSTDFVDKLNKLNYPGVPMSKNNLVPFVKEIKSLGVILDNKLSWESHISLICKKVNRVL